METVRIARRWADGRLAIAVAAVGCWVAWPAGAQITDYWVAGDGDFNTPAHWSSNAVPGPLDHARFDTGAAHDVSLSAGVTNHQLTVGATSAGHGTTVMLDLGGHTYTVTSTGTGTGAALLVGNFANGNLTVTNGTLNTAGFIVGRSPSSNTGSGELVFTGANTFWNSGTADGHVGREGSSALLRIENQAQATVGVLTIGAFDQPTSSVIQVTGAGTLLNLQGGMIWGSSSLATVQVQDQGLFLAQITGDANVNANAEFWINEAAAVFEGVGANRQLNIRGLTTIENGGTLTATNQMTRVRVRAGGVLVVGTEGGVHVNQIYFEDADSTLRAVLHTGATNALITATGSGNQLHNVALFEVELAPGFSSAPGEVFTIIESGGWHPSHPVFKDLPEGAEISVAGFAYPFQVSYQDNNFTLTTIPEPGVLTLLGIALGALFAFRRRSGRM